MPPIGTCEWLDVQPSRVVAETRFAQNVPFAGDVFKLYEQGILKGWSIGFVPRKSSKRALNDGRVGLRIEQWDLFEYSAVPIPENPGALTVGQNFSDNLDDLADELASDGGVVGDYVTQIVNQDPLPDPNATTTTTSTTSTSTTTGPTCGSRL